MGDLLEEGTVQSCKDLVEVIDSNGAILRVKRYRGKNFTPCVVGNVQDHIDQVEKMEVRPDDVFITTFPKSGKVKFVVNLVRAFYFHTFNQSTLSILSKNISRLNFEIQSNLVISNSLISNFLPLISKWKSGPCFNMKLWQQVTK